MFVVVFSWNTFCACEREREKKGGGDSTGRGRWRRERETSIILRWLYTLFLFSFFVFLACVSECFVFVVCLGLSLYSLFAFPLLLYGANEKTIITKATHCCQLLSRINSQLSWLLQLTVVGNVVNIQTDLDLTTLGNLVQLLQSRMLPSSITVPWIVIVVVCTSWVVGILFCFSCL